MQIVVEFESQPQHSVDSERPQHFEDRRCHRELHIHRVRQSVQTDRPVRSRRAPQRPLCLYWSPDQPIRSHVSKSDRGHYIG